MPVVKLLVQPGSDTDLNTLLKEKRPPVTVDENGGLFSQSAGQSEAHTLISGGNQEQGELSRVCTEQDYPRFGDGHGWPELPEGGHENHTSKTYL